MRTTVDLIEELHAESIGSNVASLVVGFGNTTLFVCANAEDPLSELNEMIQNGGQPVGIIRMAQDGPELSLVGRPLEEYAGDDWIRQYLVSLTQTFRDQLLKLSPSARSGPIVFHSDWDYE
jgi:hypothetical protein